MYINIYIYIYLRINTHACCVCVNISLCYIYLYMCTYTHIYIHIHTHSHCCSYLCWGLPFANPVKLCWFAMLHCPVLCCVIPIAIARTCRAFSVCCTCFMLSGVLFITHSSFDELYFVWSNTRSCYVICLCILCASDCAFMLHSMA